MITATAPSVEQLADALGRVSENWLKDTDPLRYEAVEALRVSTGFSASLIEHAIDAAFAEATKQKILDYIDAEPALQTTPPLDKTILHILPANVFTAWIPGAITTLLLGHRCWLKPSLSEPIFPELWKRSLARRDAELGARVRITAWKDSLLKDTDGVVAYGSDETLKQIQERIPPAKIFVGYGHKWSMAVVFREALRDEESVFVAARRDILPFQLQGCLSPQVIYVEGKGLKNLSEQYAADQPVPRVRSFAAWDHLEQELAAFKPLASAVGYAGPEYRIREWAPRLERLGFTRICRLGEMQQPPLTWRNGGFSLAEKLLPA